jgi:hypothetical protein
MVSSNLSIGDTVIVENSALAVIYGRNKFDGTFLVRFVRLHSKEEHGTALVRVKMDSCLLATQAAWVLYGKGPISNFFKILERGHLGES